MEKSGTEVSISLGVPGAVVGCLLALKFAGLTFMSYTDIIWYGIKVWIICAIATLIVFLIFAFIMAIVRS